MTVINVAVAAVLNRFDSRDGMTVNVPLMAIVMPVDDIDVAIRATIVDRCAIDVTVIAPTSINVDADRPARRAAATCEGRAGRNRDDRESGGNTK